MAKECPNCGGKAVAEKKFMQTGTETDEEGNTKEVEIEIAHVKPKGGILVCEDCGIAVDPKPPKEEDENTEQ